MLEGSSLLNHVAKPDLWRRSGPSATRQPKSPASITFEVDLDVHFDCDRFRCGFALQHSGRKTILLHRSNGVLIEGVGKRANYVNLLRLALLVDGAGYDNYASLVLSRRKFRVGCRD